IVIAEIPAYDWVVSHERMAFMSHVQTDGLSVGDRMALYLTQGAFHNPTREGPRVAALGEIASPVVDTPAVVAGEHYARSCRLSFEETLAAREGAPFRPIVPELRFIKKKEAWWAYLRRTLVRLGEDDYAAIARSFRQQRRAIADQQRAG